MRLIEYAQTKTSYKDVTIDVKNAFHIAFIFVSLFLDH